MRASAAYAEEVLRRLKGRYGEDLRTFLSHSNEWQLIVSTILSAQTQDSQVNKFTEKMFKRYKTPKEYARLKPKQLYVYTKHLNFYRNKSKNIIRAAKFLIERFHSKVPRTLGELMMLPGVGRKTANVVLSNAYGINEGIAIDTHCITTANRLGFVRSRDPEKIEKRLMERYPQREWRQISLLLISLGRDTCTARAKYCSRCVLRDICPSSNAR